MNLCELRSPLTDGPLNLRGQRIAVLPPQGTIQGRETAGDGEMAVLIRRQTQCDIPIFTVDTDVAIQFLCHSQVRVREIGGEGEGGADGPLEGAILEDQLAWGMNGIKGYIGERRV